MRLCLKWARFDTSTVPNNTGAPKQPHKQPHTSKPCPLPSVWSTFCRNRETTGGSEGLLEKLLTLNIEYDFCQMSSVRHTNSCKHHLSSQTTCTHPRRVHYRHFRLLVVVHWEKTGVLEQFLTKNAICVSLRHVNCSRSPKQPEGIQDVCIAVIPPERHFVTVENEPPHLQT
jgi:hypothetical protein